MKSEILAQAICPKRKGQMYSEGGREETEVGGGKEGKCRDLHTKSSRCVS